MLRAISIKSLRPLFIALVLLGLAAIRATGGGTLPVLRFIEAEYDYMGLYGARSVAVSPDSQHVYVAGAYEDTVAVFSFTPVLGYLSTVELQQDGVGGVDGLNNPQSIAVSPDGNHVYVASFDDDAVAVFSRNSTTGALTYVEMQQDSVGGVNGLAKPQSVAVSPDGSHVYVTGSWDNAVAVFSRSVITGGLTYVEMQKDGVGGVDGLYAARSVTVSPDGLHVYVTSEGEDAVAVFGRNPTSGALTYVEMQQDGVGGVDGLDLATGVAVSPDGNHVYVTGQFDDAVAVFSRSVITGGLSFVEMQQDGVGGVDGLDSAREVAVSPDGGHVYVASAGEDAVAVFSRSAITGGLTYVEMQQNGVGGVDGLGYVQSVAVSPDGFYAYAVGRDDRAVVVFYRNGATGELTCRDIRKDSYPAAEGLDGARSVVVSPDGNHVYVAGRHDDALVTFDRDGSGALTFVEVITDGTPLVDGLDGANSVAASPDGRHIYVSSVHDNAVAAFNRNVSSGKLSFLQVITDGMSVVDGLEFATSVAVSPDGRHVYATAAVDDAVTAFVRYTTTGQLGYLHDIRDGDMSGFVNGLDGAYSVAISPDGYHAYVAAGQDDAVSVFVRNPNTGYLTFVEVVTDTGSTVNGLDRARSVTVSPDGEHVYVASLDANSLTVYDRNPATGQLTFVEIHQNGVGGAHSLEGAHTVAVSPDGLQVYVGSSADNAFLVFWRDVPSGRLTLEDTHLDQYGLAGGYWWGVHGLDYPASIAVSPSGRHVYVASYEDDGVAVFLRISHCYLPLLLRSS